MDKVIFVDRDGVINVDLIGDYVKTLEEFQFEAGAIEALQLFQEAGYKIIIISNQAGVGEGIFTEDALNVVHNHMLEELKKQGVCIFGSHYCLCSKNAGCNCRKPKTGLFDRAAETVTFDKSETYFVGDKATDIEAGVRYGLNTAFVRTGHGVTDEAKLGGDVEPTLRADNFLEATKAILA